MASMRKVEQQLEAGDWNAAARECGVLLEAILRKIYEDTKPHLSNAAKTTIEDHERTNRKRVEKFTLGPLTKAFKAAGVFTRAEIGLGRRLPHLIGADWDTLVPLRNKSAHPGKIVTRAEASFFAAYVSVFLEELDWKLFDGETASTSIDPFELFKDFDLLERLLKPRRYARSEPQDVVGNVLLHSIQPAYYLDKLEVLQDYSRRVGKNPDLKPMADVLLDARTIVENACAVYAGLKRHEDREYFEAVKTRLGMPSTAAIDEKKGSWPEAIRLDFLGLCYYHLYLNARKDGQSVSEAALLKNAREAFEQALAHLDRLNVPPMESVAGLWKGYALRNLGAVLAASGEPELARRSYGQALDERKRTYQRLSGDCIPLIAKQLLVEVELVKIDIAELEGESEALAESTSRLLQMRQDLPAVWPHLEERLYESAIALSAPLIAENVVLTAIEDRLSRLTGEASAQLIRDEVRSGKVIHEVIVLRCRGTGSGPGHSNSEAAP
jgi:tetratricopeptide (TPR) repeat protein